MLSDIVKGVFSGSPKSVVFHYTSYPGLMGIADSKTLRLSEVQHLNDTQELDDLKRWLYQEIDARVVKYSQEIRKSGREVFDDVDLGRDILNLRSFQSWMFLTMGVKTLALFVGSFTERGNLLSQWRGYCPFGKGVSIGFEPNKLSECANRASMLFGRCIYDAEKKQGLAKKIVDEVIDFCRKKGPIPVNMDPFTEPHYFSDIELDLLNLASLIKHDDFREELEWRIVLPAIEMDKAPIAGYREGKSALVPYVDFNLPVSDDDKLLIDQIFLGPTSDEELAFRSLERFARDKTACQKVHRSRSPYRET